MRVTFLTHYPELYGANRSLLALLDGLREYGVDRRVILPRQGPMADELRDRGIPLSVCRLGRWASALPVNSMPGAIGPLRQFRSAAAQVKANFQALPAVVKQIREWKTDVVYTNSSILLSGALAAACLRLPHLWHLREFGELDYGFVPDFGLRFQKWLIDRSQGIIAISNSIRDHYRRNDGSRIHIVPSGIGWDTDFERWRKEAVDTKVHRHEYVFALIGVVHPGKGQETAIRAIHIIAQKRPEVRLQLVGSGRLPYRQYLEDLVDRLALRRHVEFCGYTSDVYSAYRRADAVLMCSRNEGMGRVTAEAMAACLPVIGFRSAGTEEIIDHESTGLLFDGGVRELADSMIRFVDDPAWARQLGMNAWHAARDRFTIERYAAEVFRVLSSVASDMPATRISRTPMNAPGAFEAAASSRI